MTVTSFKTHARCWTTATVADTGRYINGLAFKPSDWVDRGRPIIRIQNLTDPTKSFNMTDREVPSDSIVKRGDILVSWSATLDAFRWDGPEAVLNQHIFKVEPREDRVRSTFLFYLLKHVIRQMWHSEHAHGSTMRHINRGPFLSFKIGLPDLNEQDAIVSEIEKHFTRLDAATEMLAETDAKLRVYRKALLHAATTGHLLPPRTHSIDDPQRAAAELMPAILASRQQKWIEARIESARHEAKSPDLRKIAARYRPPLAPENTAPLAAPAGWQWVTVDQLAWSVKDGPHFSPEYVTAGGVPFVTGGNVRPEGIDFESAKRISWELHEELSRRTVPTKGDVLYTKGGTTGIARVNTYDTDFNVWVHVAVLKLVDGVEPFYLQHALNSPLCYAQSQRFTHGVGNQDLGLTRMVRIQLLLPPIAEQREIVAEVDRRLSLVTEVEHQVATAMKRATALRKAVLAAAFAGKLPLSVGQLTVGV